MSRPGGAKTKVPRWRYGVNLVLHLEVLLREVGDAAARGPERCEKQPVKVITSLKRRCGRATWFSPHSHRVRTTWRRRRYVVSSSGMYGVTTNGELIRFCPDGVFDDEGYQAFTRKPGMSRLKPLRNQWQLLCVSDLSYDSVAKIFDDLKPLRSRA